MLEPKRLFGRRVNIGIICLILWFIFLARFPKRLLGSQKALIRHSLLTWLVVMPLLCVLNIVRASGPEAEDLHEARCRTNKRFSELIPAIIFGLALMLSAPVFKGIFQRVVPFLVLALLLGTLTPYLVTFLSDREDPPPELQTVLYFCECLAFSLLIASVTTIFLRC